MLPLPMLRIGKEISENKIKVEHPALRIHGGFPYAWHKVYNLPVNSMRIFNAYGPRVRTTGAYGAYRFFLNNEQKNPHNCW